MTVLSTSVKLRWNIDLTAVIRHLDEVIDRAATLLEKSGLEATPVQPQLSLFSDLILPHDVRISTPAEALAPNELLPPNTRAIIPSGFISEKPLLRVLAVRQAIEHVKIQGRGDIYEFMALALATTILSDASNVGFGPEVYKKEPAKEDVDVLRAFAGAVEQMVGDLTHVLATSLASLPPSMAGRDDARLLNSLAVAPPIGIVITSPPYPNEKDYTRSTRLESVLLGLLEDKKDLRLLKEGLLRSNTRNVFMGDSDDQHIADIPSITNLATLIENTRIKLGKTSGFERLYHRVTRLYFGGMYLHLSALYPHLRPGAKLAYVVGDQASYFRVLIPTARLLADVAIKAGYHVEGIELWRTRWSSATKQNIDENILILTRP